MKYAKLIDGIIVYATCKITIEDVVIYNPTAEMLIGAGYKPVHYTDPPATEPGYIAVPNWVETTDEIVQIWSEVEEPDEVNADRAMEILFGGDN